MTKPVIVNVGIGSWCPRGSLRLRDSLHANDKDTDLLQWTTEYPPGSPTHEDIPYAFKVFAIEAAIGFGYRHVMWLDSAAIVHRPLAPLWEIVGQGGWFFCDNGYITGEWCSDKALENLCVERDYAMQVPSVTGGCFALDTKNALAQEFLHSLKRAALDGSTFPGAWVNDEGVCSADPRVKGHRHDQSAMSLIVDRLGMYVHPKKNKVFCNEVPVDQVPEEILISNHGM